LGAFFAAAPQKTGLSRQPLVARAPAPALRAGSAPHPSYPLRGRKTASLPFFALRSCCASRINSNIGKSRHPCRPSLRMFAFPIAALRAAIHGCYSLCAEFRGMPRNSAKPKRKAFCFGIPAGLRAGASCAGNRRNGKGRSIQGWKKQL
jgi:hypothetical protein